MPKVTREHSNNFIQNIQLVSEGFHCNLGVLKNEKIMNFTNWSILSKYNCNDSWEEMLINCQDTDDKFLTQRE